jgi:hypothetical protein
MTVPTSPPDLPARRPGSDIGRPNEPAENACPHCGARIRPEQPWCTLCHTSLGRAAAVPGVQPDRPPAPGVGLEPEVQPEVQPELAPVGPQAEAEPQLAPSQQPNPNPDPVVRADALLAQLAVVERRAPMPAVLARLVGEGPAGRAVLGVGVGLTVFAVLVGLLGLLGLLL